MGESGQMLRPMLAELGLPDPYITNVAKCRPPDNRKPEPEEIRACRSYLDEEIADRKPKAILLLGATAMKSFIGKASITQMNGQVVEKDGRTYVCAFHPAYILRDPSKMPALKMALGRYAAVVNETFTPEMPKWRAIDKSSIDDFLESWDRCEGFTFDVETGGEPGSDTTGLEWWKDDFHVYSIAFSLYDEKQTWRENWALSIRSPEVLPFELTKEFIEHLVETQGDRIANGQNAKFDNHCLRVDFGVGFKLDTDTQLVHHLVDENSEHGLKSLARHHLGAPDYDLTSKEKKMIWIVPVRKRLQYNACDSHYTGQLHPMFYSRLDADERWLYEKVVMPASRTLEDAEQDGMYVNVEFLNNAGREEHQKMLKALAELNKIAGREINWNSPQQVAEVLYQDLKLEPIIFTDKGAPSTGELALTYIDHPVREVLEKYRGHEKFLSTYTGRPQEDGTFVGGWRDFMLGPHLFLSTKIIGTVTGRYSSRLHQTPRDATIRNAVTAPPGWTHFQLDLSQAELRTMAIMTGDPEMIRCFNAGEDIHWRTLMQVIQVSSADHYFDLMRQTLQKVTKKRLDFEAALNMIWEMGKFDPDQVIDINKDWKEERKKSKGVNFGFVFGQSPPGFINFAKVKYGFEPTLEEATVFHSAYFDLYRTLRRFHERQVELARMDGFVRSMSGRKRHLPAIHSGDRIARAEAERQAINSPVQGFIGDYKAMIMVELDQSFPRDRFRIKGEVHDAILGWIKNEHIDEVMPELYDRARKPRLAKECGLEFPIKMEIDVDLGDWGKGRKWKPKQKSAATIPTNRSSATSRRMPTRRRG